MLAGLRSRFLPGLVGRSGAVAPLVNQSVLLQHSSSKVGSRGFSNSKAIEGSLDHLLKQNRDWAESERPSLRPLQAGQQPKYLVICCSDSRCPPTNFMGLGIGECFVVRNVANQILSMDLSVSTAINYGIEVLNIEQILVIGHRGCGGVAAALTPRDFGDIDPWIRNIRDVWRLHRKSIDALPEEEKLDRLVELNVIEQCINLYKFPCVQRKRRECLENKKTPVPQIHGLVYNPEDGLLKELEIDLREDAKDFVHIYNLVNE